MQLPTASATGQGSRRHICLSYPILLLSKKGKDGPGFRSGGVEVEDPVCFTVRKVGKASSGNAEVAKDTQTEVKGSRETRDHVVESERERDLWTVARKVKQTRPAGCGFGFKSVRVRDLSVTSSNQLVVCQVLPFWLVVGGPKRVLCTSSALRLLALLFSFASFDSAWWPRVRFPNFTSALECGMDKRAEGQKRAPGEPKTEPPDPTVHAGRPPSANVCFLISFFSSFPTQCPRHVLQSSSAFLYVMYESARENWAGGLDL